MEFDSKQVEASTRHVRECLEKLDDDVKDLQQKLNAYTNSIKDDITARMKQLLGEAVRQQEAIAVIVDRMNERVVDATNAFNELERKYGGAD